MNENNQQDFLPISERNRSNFAKTLIQHANERAVASATQQCKTPKRIVQFWDNLSQLPGDVAECMDSWRDLERFGYELQVFDENTAREFIRIRLGARYQNAFDRCYHPSMKSDYFRYSYIFVEGGFYVDADDVYHGLNIDQHFEDSRLKLQPFCYDITTAQMVSPSVFAVPGANQWSWIFYFNTTPLIAGRNHPIVERALMNATTSLEEASTGDLPEVQATTGPGNLTRSIFEILGSEHCPEESFVVMHDWERISTSKWPLSYRNDRRNWRLSNQQTFDSTDRP